MKHLQSEHSVSERRACRVANQHRSTQRHPRKPCDSEGRLLKAIQTLAQCEPSWGSPRIFDRLRLDGWKVNHKRVERLWRTGGFQVRQKRRKRRRTGVSANGILRHRPEHPGHVWTYDFLTDRTDDGRRLKVLGVLDEFTRECLALKVGRHFRSGDVIDVLEELVAEHGRPKFVRSDNGPEFIADAVKDWFGKRDIGTLFIAPGSPWENGYIESFFGGLRRDLMDLEIFVSLQEAQALLEMHRRSYNEYRPHSALGRVPPALFKQQIQESAGLSGTTKLS